MLKFNRMQWLNLEVKELIINEQRLYDCTTEEEANLIKPLIEKNKSNIIKYSPYFDKK